MKAILVLDMPKSCTDCPYLGFEKDTKKPACVICEGRFKKDEDIENERSIICPLRPMPKKEEKPSKGEDDYNDFCIGYTRGWNECLDEITGETE